METKGWKKIRNIATQKNPYYSFKEDEVLTPRGLLGRYFYVDLPVSVMVVVEDKDGGLFLVGQYRYPTGNIYSWEFVSGSAEADEAPLVAAQRELREELGLLAESWQELGMVYPCNGYSSEKSYIFIARELKKIETHFDVSEDLQSKKVSLVELQNMILHSEVSCGQTIAALQKYLFFMKKI